MNKTVLKCLLSDLRTFINETGEEMGSVSGQQAMTALNIIEEELFGIRGVSCMIEVGKIGRTQVDVRVVWDESKECWQDIDTKYSYLPNQVVGVDDFDAYAWLQRYNDLALQQHKMLSEWDTRAARFAQKHRK